DQGAIKPSDHGSIPFPADTIHPLLTLQNLTWLILDLHRVVDVDNMLLKTMATSWPQIRVLDLARCWNRPEPIRLTLEGLIPLAEHCKKLTMCSLLVDARTVPINYFKNPAGRYPSRLQSFGCGGSPIAESYRVAAFLSGVFPELQGIACADADADNLDRWMAVNNSIRAFHEVRNQERLSG
ncbi:hypothetical protein C8F04DRAFT_980787, partial [Mycena alexandri]